MGEKTVFSTNNSRKIEYPHAKKLSWTNTSHHMQKLKSKWIKDLNSKQKT